MAFKLSKLSDKLKSEGLDIVEEDAKKLLNLTIDWVEESAKETPGVVAVVVNALMPHVKSFLLKQIDRIDGEKD